MTLALARPASGLHPRMRTIRLIGAEIGEGASDQGCRAGPRALQQFGLARRLRSQWAGMVSSDSALQAKGALALVQDFSLRLAASVEQTMASGSLPRVGGGYLSCAIGTWSAVAEALRAKGRVGLVWVDAHLDSHTPETSETKAVHGMSLAALMGFGGMLAGGCAGLMLATKETAPLALGSMVLALALTDVADRWRADALPAIRSVVRRRDALLALVMAIAVCSALFSSFSSHPRGILDALRSYGIYLGRAGAASWHVHPWDYYLRLLIHFPARGTPVWTEGLILLLAAAGCAAGWRAKGRAGADSAPGADPRVLRFLGFYTLLLLGVYSAIPYKTPWCLLGFLHGMILLAGAGAVFLVQACRGVAAKAVVCTLLVCAAAHLGWQAFCGSFRFAADARNPYVYAHTGTDVFLIAARLEALARAHPNGTSMPVQIISRENLWPLPWYLRRLTRVAWWNGVSEQARSAPVILVTPDMEPALVRKLYDLPPPGERELYTSIFERTVELRPGIELRGYAARTLWDDWLRLEAASSASPGPGAKR